MKIPLVFDSFEHPSQDANYQKCINMFRASAGPLGRADALENPGVLLSRRGKRLMVDLGGNKVRALVNKNNTIYAVCDNQFYQLTINDQSKTATASSSLGTLNSNSRTVRHDQNTSQIMLVDGQYGYVYNTTTSTFATISDADFQGADTVVFIDGYFFYSVPDTSYVAATAINDGTDINALDIVSSEGRPDRGVAVLSDKRELWSFGTKSVEIYYNAANATGFPFSKRDGAFIDQGCAAAHSVLNIDNTIVWLDDRQFVVQVGISNSGYAPTVISSPAASKEMQKYAIVSDAFAWQEVDRGHLTYNISFPTENKTWSYDLSEKTWTQKAYWSQNDEFVRDLTNCHVRYKNMDLVGDFQSGKIYVLDDDYYLDGGEPIHRLVTTAHQSVEFGNISVDELELRVETGKAGITDDEAYIMMRYSVDGGYSWSAELTQSLGLTGEYSKRIRWNLLGSGIQWMFEFRIVAPYKVSILDANVKVSGELSAQ